MAEAFAVIGIVANIVQLADFGAKVLERLNEFQSRSQEIPKPFRDVKIELPILLQTLKETKLAIQHRNVDEETTKALLLVVNGCQDQITLLDDLLKKVLPNQTDSWTKKTGKALLSFRQDSKINGITTGLRTHIQSLTNYRVAVLSTQTPAIGIYQYSLDIRRGSTNIYEELSFRPKPSSTVPFRRDRDFIYRDILSDIHAKCSEPAARVALVGLGGVG